MAVLCGGDTPIRRTQNVSTGRICLKAPPHHESLDVRAKCNRVCRPLRLSKVLPLVWRGPMQSACSCHLQQTTRFLPCTSTLAIYIITYIPDWQGPVPHSRLHMGVDTHFNASGGQSSRSREQDEHTALHVYLKIRRGVIAAAMATSTWQSKRILGKVMIYHLATQHQSSWSIR